MNVLKTLVEVVRPKPIVIEKIVYSRSARSAREYLRKREETTQQLRREVIERILVDAVARAVGVEAER